MDTRQQEGAIIAATSRIVQKGRLWSVPSQSESGKKYTVDPDEQSPYCSCPDHETRGITCKHIHAARMVMKREQNSDGSETVTETTTYTETKRTTYPQQWKEYNEAQKNEKRDFRVLLRVLLRDLCACLPDPAPARGNKAIRPADAVFAAIYKVYSTVSARRFMTDLREAHEAGFLRECPSYNSIFKALESPDMTEVLKSS